MASERRAPVRRIWTATLAMILATASLGLPGPWRLPAGALISRVGTTFAASEAPSTCAAIDRTLVQIDVPLMSTTGAPAVGRVFSLSDGAIAVLVIVNRLTSGGGVGAADFSASVRVSAAIVRSAAGVNVVRFDPPVRSRSALTASDGSAIETISFCYRIAIPSPPAPAQPDRTSTAAPPAESPTPVQFDLGAVQTANAQAATTVSQANETAVAGQTALAESEATANVYAETAVAQASQIAMLQETASAPTPTATAPPRGAALFSAETDEAFSDFELVDGWKVDGGLVASGSATQAWAALPAIPGLGANQAIEAEIQIGGGSCPRNFGFALRGSETGFAAGGVDWACDQSVKLWSGQSVLDQTSTGDLGSDWHLFRLEARGTDLQLYIDEALVLRSTTTQTAGGQIAIWSTGVPLKVRAVRVFNLP